MTEKSDEHQTDLNDTAAFAENMANAWVKAQEGWTRFMQSHPPDSLRPVHLDPFHVMPAYAELMRAMMEHPEKAAQSTVNLWNDYATLWRNTWLRSLGAEADPVVPGAASDKRFKDKAWTENVLFDHVKQSYLLAANCISESVSGAEGLNDHDRQKVEFFTKRFVEALSPSNFLATNPEALRATIESKGENLVRGVERMMKDFERGHGELWITQTDMEAFTLGENVACTPGKVIYQNDVMQLIQYAPTTEKVSARPMLIVPPWINKYYILDLNPQKSLVRWLVEQGHSVFVISWVNPQPGGPMKGFEDYIKEGFLEALDVTLKETGADKANVAGYCIGGTMLSSALAYMGKKKDERVSSATFFTAQTDFEKAGELKVFLDEETVKVIEETTEAEGGVLGAQHMAQAFNLMRGSELIWSFVVNNYYLGKDPSAFDMLFWNADATQMPAGVHIRYIRDFYMTNKLAKGELEIFGEVVNLKDVTIPVYSVCAKEDHIAPAISVYRGVQLYGGPVKLVVGGSGHIAGIINPPEKKKYQFWTYAKQPKAWPESLETWLEGAEETAGSWWENWASWLSRKSGKKVDPREPGAVSGVLEDAPGSYVKVRSDDQGGWVACG